MLVGPNEKWGYEHRTPAMSGKRAQAVDTTKYSPPPASPKFFVITHDDLPVKKILHLSNISPIVTSPQRLIKTFLIRTRIIKNANIKINSIKMSLLVAIQNEVSSVRFAI
jgi:hypothetical protein